MPDCPECGDKKTVTVGRSMTVYPCPVCCIKRGKLTLDRARELHCCRICGNPEGGAYTIYDNEYAHTACLRKLTIGPAVVSRVVTDDHFGEDRVVKWDAEQTKHLRERLASAEPPPPTEAPPVPVETDSRRRWL